MPKTQDAKADEIRKAVSDGVVSGVSKVVAIWFLGGVLAVGLAALLHFKSQLDHAGYGAVVDIPLTIALVGFAIRMMLYGKDAWNLTKW